MSLYVHIIKQKKQSSLLRIFEITVNCINWDRYWNLKLIDEKVLGYNRNTDYITWKLTITLEFENLTIRHTFN